MRRRRVVRQEQEERQVIAGSVLDCGEVQDTGDKDQPIEIHPVTGTQMFRQSRRAEDAIALAAKILRRKPALVPRRPEPDEFTDGIQVRGLSEKGLGLLVFDGAAEPGRDRINEHQIAGVQDGILVVLQPEWRLRQRAILVHLYAARTERPEVQPDRRRPRSAIEAKRDNPGGFIGLTGPRVGHIENRAARGAVRFKQREHSCFRHVTHVPAGDSDRVGREHRLVRCVGNQRLERLGGGR